MGSEGEVRGERRGRQTQSSYMRDGISTSDSVYGCTKGHYSNEWTTTISW